MFVILIFPKKETLQLTYSLISTYTGFSYHYNKVYEWVGSITALGTWSVVDDTDTDQMVWCQAAYDEA